jgi:hypothetical protein
VEGYEVIVCLLSVQDRGDDRIGRELVVVLSSDDDHGWKTRYEEIAARGIPCETNLLESSRQGQTWYPGMRPKWIERG